MPPGKGGRAGGNGRRFERKGKGFAGRGVPFSLGVGCFEPSGKAGEWLGLCVNLEVFRDLRDLFAKITVHQVTDVAIVLMNTMKLDPERGWSVWSDSVCLDGDRLIIHATEPMDWPVREMRGARIPVQPL